MMSTAEDAENRHHAQQSLTKWTQVIDQNPSNAAAYSNRSATRWKLEDYRGALADADRAIELNSKDALAYVNRSAARLALGDSERAMEDAEQAVRLAPCLETARRNLHAVSERVSLSDSGPSRPRFVKSIAGQPVNLINVADQMRAVRENPDDPWAFLRLSLARLGGQEYEGAEEAATKAILLDSSLDLAYVSRSIARQRLGDIRRADEDIIRAEKIRQQTLQARGLDVRWISDAFLLQVLPFKSYPSEALGARLEGKVTVRAAVREGTGTQVELYESSGSGILDRAALALVQRALPICLPAPLRKPEVILLIPINYQLNP